MLSRERLAKTSKNDESKAFWITLQIAFPIFVGFDKNEQFKSLKISPNWMKNIEDIWKKTKKDKLWEDYTKSSAGPIKWIIEIMEQRLPTDIIYEAYVEEIKQYVDRRYDINNNDFSRIWEELEIIFFNSALNVQEGVEL